MDCAPYIYLLSFKRKTSLTLVPCWLCSVSYQLFMGPVSEDWHRGLRHPAGSSLRDLGAELSWRLHGYLIPCPQHLLWSCQLFFHLCQECL